MPELPEESEATTSATTVSPNGHNCKCKLYKSSTATSSPPPPQPPSSSSSVNHCRNRSNKCQHNVTCCKSSSHSSHSPVQSTPSSRSNLTKITTLKLAVNYIAALTEILKNSEATANDVSMSCVDDETLPSLNDTPTHTQSPMQMQQSQVSRVVSSHHHLPSSSVTSSTLTPQMALNDENKRLPCDGSFHTYNNNLHDTHQMNVNRYISSSCVAPQQQMSMSEQQQPHQSSSRQLHETCQTIASATTVPHVTCQGTPLLLQPQQQHLQLASPAAYNSSSPAPSSSNSSSWLSDWDPFSSPVGAGGGLTPEVDSLVGDVCDTFDLILESDEFQ